MTVWDFGQREVWSIDCLEINLNLNYKQRQALSAFYFHLHQLFPRSFKGKDLSFCVVYCLMETSLSWIIWAIRDFKLISGFCEPAWCATCCPDPRWRCPIPAWQLQHPPPHSPPLGVGVRVPQVPHITPQLRPPVQPKTSQHAASWPPVDAGRLNVTHIIIHRSRELGKEGRDGELVCERRGARAGLLCPGQLKSLQPPLWTYSTSPHPDQKPSTLPQQWWIKTSTCAWRAQAALGGLVRD